MGKTTEEPKGISFYNIDSNETHYLKLEPTIQAYINSSDMGINASRDQDFSWRLSAEWVKKVKAFRRDNTKMSILTARTGGQKPSMVQVLYYLYGEELRAYQEEIEEHEHPYAEQYQRDIASDSDSHSDDADDDEDLTEEPVKPTKQTQK